MEVSGGCYSTSLARSELVVAGVGDIFDLHECMRARSVEKEQKMGVGGEVVGVRARKFAVS